MRDPRFTLVAETRDVSAKTEMVRLLSLASERTDLDAVMRAWWAEVLARDSPSKAAFAKELERLRLSCSSLPGAQKTLGLQACTALLGSNGTEFLAAAHVLGSTAAAAIRGDANDIARLDRAVQHLSECWEAVEVLMEALNSAPRWPVDAKILVPNSAEVDSLVAADFGRRAPNSALLDEEQKVRACGLLEYFSDPRYERVHLAPRAWVRLSLLARRDWDGLAESAENLPLRELRQDLWQHLHLHEDRDAIHALLSASGPVFQGNRWTGRTVGLTALQNAVRHADLLHGALERKVSLSEGAKDAGAAQVAATIQIEFPQWFHGIMQTAYARTDGRALLLFFGASLIREALRAQMGQRPWSSANLAIAALQQVIVPPPTTDEIKAIARLGLAKGSNDADRMVYAVAAAVFNCEARPLWSFYRQLLSEADDSLCYQTKTWRRGICYDAIASRLAVLPNAFDEWRGAWKSLFVSDRERARFETSSRSALLPSVHLVRVGSALLRHAPSEKGAREFYSELRAKIRSLVANDVRPWSPVPREFPTEGFDVAPAVLGDVWPDAFEMERSLLTPAEVRVYAAVTLLEIGEPVDLVEAALEEPPHRLVDTLVEASAERNRDDNLRRQCDYVRAAVTQTTNTGLN